MTANQCTNNVDASTLEKKLVMGYQGWFACPDDHSGTNRWWHWFKDNSSPDAANLAVDMWPDTSEFGVDELFPTNLTHSNEQAAVLYSSYKASVVDRHFSWMQYHNLDGVMLQRFVCDLDLQDLHSPFMNFRDEVTRNVMVSAEAHGRAFAIMYDISGYKGTSLVKDITGDWSHLVGDLNITKNKLYLNHDQKPLLAIWGMGFNDPNSNIDNYPATPDDALSLTKYFKDNNVTIMGGVPYRWRTLDAPDMKTEKAWAQVYQSFNIISPWSVGRYSAENENAIGQIDAVQRNMIENDRQYLSTNAPAVEYMPVVFPGYSQHNAVQGKSFNEIKRYGGKFWWRQIYNAISAGSTMIYGAMFDEVNEGTAMFKLVANQQDLPVVTPNTLVSLDVDRYNVPSDWYLHLADAAGRMLRQETSLTDQIPIEPGFR